MKTLLAPTNLCGQFPQTPAATDVIVESIRINHSIILDFFMADCTMTCRWLIYNTNRSCFYSRGVRTVKKPECKSVVF